VRQVAAAVTLIGRVACHGNNMLLLLLLLQLQAAITAERQSIEKIIILYDYMQRIYIHVTAVQQLLFSRREMNCGYHA